jgi:LDH2 family malate/lactate/ureidoglycolate dehydrogenase
MEAGRRVVVAAAELVSLVRACGVGMGLADDDAEALAAVLVDANLRGVDSHGLARLPIYLRRLHGGLVRGTHGVAFPPRSAPTCRIDARTALGPAIAVKAVDHAVALARRHGIGLVAVANSTHFGHAGFYARRAAAQRLIAIVMTNGPAGMAPHGGTEAFLGTNPLAIGIPLGDRGEFVLDMSSSVAARGKIIRRHALGEPIEEGWAVDATGEPTTVAAAALAGAVLPVGGAKGSGMAFAVSLLVGVLAGAAFDHEVARMDGSTRPQGLGHVLLVIDPWRLAPEAETLLRVEDLVDRLHAVHPAPGFDRVLHAGERGEVLAAERRRAGVPVVAAEIEAVAAACDELGLASASAAARTLASERVAV